MTGPETIYRKMSPIEAALLAQAAEEELQQFERTVPEPEVLIHGVKQAVQRRAESGIPVNPCDADEIQGMVNALLWPNDHDESAQAVLSRMVVGLAQTDEAIVVWTRGVN
jgi:hypothetical protein